MRLIVGRLIALIERYPALVNGAFIIIAWVGIKLIAEYLHGRVYPYRHSAVAVPWPVGVIFLASFVRAAPGTAEADNDRKGHSGAVR